MSPDRERSRFSRFRRAAISLTALATVSNGCDEIPKVEPYRPMFSRLKSEAIYTPPTIASRVEKPRREVPVTDELDCRLGPSSKQILPGTTFTVYGGPGISAVIRRDASNDKGVLNSLHFFTDEGGTGSTNRDESANEQRASLVVLDGGPKITVFASGETDNDSEAKCVDPADLERVRMEFVFEVFSRGGTVQERIVGRNGQNRSNLLYVAPPAA